MIWCGVCITMIAFNSSEVFTASRALLTFLPKLHTAEEDRAFIANHIVPEYRLTLAEEDGRLLGYMAEGEAWITPWVWAGPCS